MRMKLVPSNRNSLLIKASNLMWIALLKKEEINEERDCEQLNYWGE